MLTTLIQITPWLASKWWLCLAVLTFRAMTHVIIPRADIDQPVKEKPMIQVHNLTRF